jgi:hypothetical protein
MKPGTCRSRRKCSSCGEDIITGTQMYSPSFGQWVHPECRVVEDDSSNSEDG